MANLNDLGKHSKIIVFLGLFPKYGGGVSIPKLHVKFWWPLFLAMKFTFLFPNVLRRVKVKEIILKKTIILECFPKSFKFAI